MPSKKLIDRLIRVERLINIFNKKDKLVKEININDLPFETIKEIIKPKDDDLLLYDGYELNENQIQLFNNHLKEKINADFNKYVYILECVGIYDWD